MNFQRPVDDRFPVCANFMEWGERYEWLMDPATGFWIPKGTRPGALGQHRGIDFDCLPGTIVSAMSDGMIVKARHENAIDYKDGAGLYVLQLVMLPGYDAWWLRYSHLRKLIVKAGDQVKKGQALAETGQSGSLDRPKLHVDLMDVRHQFQAIPWHL